MDQETGIDAEGLKKRKAKIIAGTITFFIFCFWIVYFISNTGKEYANEKPFALFEDLKQNAMKPIEEIGGFFNEIKNSFGNVVSTSTSSGSPENIATTSDQ